MPEDLENQLIPSSGDMPEGQNVIESTSEPNSPTGKKEGTSSKRYKYNKNNTLEDARGSSLYSPHEEMGKTALGKKGKRKTLSDYEAAGQANREQVRNDIKRKAALTSLYDVSYGHFKSMHARAKEEGNEVHASWCGENGFARFLIDVGPVPQLDRSLDRINCHDKEYGPGKVRWATPREQANNRKNTIMVYDPGARERAPLTVVAERLDLSAKAIRNRIDRGADPEHVVSEMLVAAARKAAHPISGKRVLIPPAEQKDKAAAVQAHMPPRVQHRRINIKTDWPASLTNEQQAQWNRSLKENRDCKDEGEYEWPFEFFMRTLRERLLAAGFAGRLLGHEMPIASRELDVMRAGWTDPEEATDAEWEAYRAREDFLNLCFERYHEALALEPQFVAEARKHRRQRKKDYFRSRDNHANAYVDEEDQAMKDAERFGPDVDFDDERFAEDDERDDTAARPHNHPARRSELRR